MFKKDIGLLILILVVGAVVSLINPRFLSPINLSNTANLIGLFGLFSIAEAFVIITGGIELSVGSIIALLGVIFIDLLNTHGVPWELALVIVIGIGILMGVIHGLLVTKMRMQPFVVTLCGLLIYRGIARYYTQDATAGFGFGESFPTLEWLTTGRLLGIIPNSMIALVVIAVVMGIVLHRSVRQFFDDLYSNPAYQPHDLDANQVFDADQLRFTRDPFDGLIVAAARALKLPLLTRDALIRESGVVAVIW